MAVAFDAVGPAGGGGTNSVSSPVTWTHVNAGNCIIVGVSAESGANPVTAVTYGGVSLPLVKTSPASGSTSSHTFFGLVSASLPQGSNTVSVTQNGSAGECVCGSISVSGAGSFGTPVIATVSSTSISVSVLGTTPGGLIIAGASYGGGSGTGVFSGTNGVTVRWADVVSNAGNGDNGVGGTVASAGGSQTVGFSNTQTTDTWNIVAVEVQPASPLPFSGGLYAPAFVPPGWFPGAPASPGGVPFQGFPSGPAFQGFLQVPVTDAEASTAADAGETIGVALTGSQLAVFTQGTGTSAVSPSVSPAANAVVFVALSFQPATGTTTVTGVSGLGLTWAKVRAQPAYDGASCSFEVWWAATGGSAPSPGTVTVTLGASATFNGVVDTVSGGTGLLTVLGGASTVGTSATSGTTAAAPSSPAPQSGASFLYGANADAGAEVFTANGALSNIGSQAGGNTGVETQGATGITTSGVKDSASFTASDGWAAICCEVVLAAGSVTYLPSYGPAFVPPGWFPGAPGVPGSTPFAQLRGDQGFYAPGPYPVSDTDSSTAADGQEQALPSFTPPYAAAAPELSLGPAYFPGAPGGVPDSPPFTAWPVPAYFPGLLNTASADASSAADAGETTGLSDTDSSSSSDGQEQALPSFTPPYAAAAPQAAPGWFPGAPCPPLGEPFTTWPQPADQGRYTAPQLAVYGADVSTALDAGESAGISDADASTAQDAGEQALPSFTPPPAAAAPVQAPGWFPGAPAAPGSVPFTQQPVPAYWPGYAALSDADASQGADAGELVTASLSDADASHGTDAGELVTAQVPDGDVSHGTDAGESLSVFFQPSYPASWYTPAPGWFPGAPGVPLGIPFQQQPVPAYAPGSFVLTLSDTDASTATEALTALVVSGAPETVSAADAGESIRQQDGDVSGTTLDAGEALHPADADTSAAGESSLSYPGPAADASGTTADAGESLSVTLSGADASHAAEAQLPLTGTFVLSDADSSSTADSGYWSGPLSSSDASQVLDAQSPLPPQLPSDADASTAAEGVPVIMGIDPFLPPWLFSAGGTRLRHLAPAAPPEPPPRSARVSLVVTEAVQVSVAVSSVV